MRRGWGRWKQAVAGRHTGAVPLTQVRSGSLVRIEEVLGGCQMAGRLAGLGVFPGVEVKVLSGSQSGPVLVARDNCRIAIGCGMANRVLVVPVQDDEDHGNRG